MAMTTAEWLFKRPVTWIVPYYATLSKFETEEFGIFMPPDPQDQNALLTRDQMWCVPTASMAESFEIHKMKLAIKDPQEAVMVYEKIMEHLANWRVILSKPSFSLQKVPIEGLREFDKLAQALFRPANIHHYKRAHINKVSQSIDAFTGTPSEVMRSPVQYNGSIMVAIENQYKARQQGKTYFWER